MLQTMINFGNGIQSFSSCKLINYSYLIYLTYIQFVMQFISCSLRNDLSDEFYGRKEWYVMLHCCPESKVHDIKTCFWISHKKSLLTNGLFLLCRTLGKLRPWISSIKIVALILFFSILFLSTSSVDLDAFPCEYC